MELSREQTVLTVDSLLHRARDMQALEVEALDEQADQLVEIARELALPLMGDPVLVIPRVNRDTGESRDTEPGLQPWNATFMAISPKGTIIVQQDQYEPHAVNPGPLSINRNGDLQIGRW